MSETPSFKMGKWLNIQKVDIDLLRLDRQIAYWLELLFKRSHKIFKGEDRK